MQHWAVILIDPCTNEGIVGHGCLEPCLGQSMRYFIPAIEDLAAIAAAREAAGATVKLMCDFTLGLSPGDALVRCHALDDHGLYRFYPEVSAHLMRVTGSALWLEGQDRADPIPAQPFELEDGLLLIPDRPGQGIAWDERAVAKFAG